jgi:hypothetical protein
MREGPSSDPDAQASHRRVVVSGNKEYSEIIKRMVLPRRGYSIRGRQIISI